MIQQVKDRLIAFTGPDGIGKTTQAKMLVDWMNSEEFRHKYNHYKVEYIKELNDSDYIFGAFRDLVCSLYNSNVSVYLIANVIKLNRYVLQDQIISQLHDHFDDIIVVDRWNICTYCYLKASGYQEEICLSYLIDKATVIPGLTIMLVGMNGATRTSNREANNNMFEDISNDFNIKLAQTYIDFDSNLYAGKVVKINNDSLSKEETHEVIKQCVLYYLESINK